MADTVIKVEGLSKRYRLGQYVGGAYQYRALRDVLTDAMYAPFRWLGARSKQQAAGSNPTTMSHQPSTDFIWALKDVFFEVKQGEVVGIIGRNGAGKTTLLKVLSRITEPTEGRAEIKGRIGSLLEVGTGFHPELTGRENIYLSGAILGMTKKEISRKFDEIVDFSGVEKFIDTPAKRYSSGMLVRLGFAVAAHLEPEILLVDEVLAVGDIEFQKKCLGKMGDIGREGRTVVLVSHNMPSIVNLCQRAILLSSGKVVSDGKSTEVVQRYLTTGRSPGGEVMWDDPIKAPGSKNVRLHAVRVLSDDGIPTANVDLGKDIRIQIDFWNFKPGIRLVKHVWLCDQFGQPIIASANRPSACRSPDPWFGRPHPIGLFRTVCRIPANLLNDKRYSINVYISSPPQHFEVNEIGILFFHPYDTGAMSKESYGRWAGVVRAALDWATEHRGPLSSSACTKAD